MKHWRTGVLMGLVCIMAAMIIVRLFYVQVISRKFYQAQALGQQSGFKEVKGARGQIFFENSKESRGSYGSGEIRSLAVNKEKWTLGAVPQNIDDTKAFIGQVAPIIEESLVYIADKLAANQTYVILKKDISAEQVAALKKLKIEGLSFESAPTRYYPELGLAAQVVGFVGGAKGSGQYGIEGYYEDQLKGKDGIQEEKSGLGLINYDDSKEYLNGSDLYLTLDYNIQFQAESLLKEAKKDIGIDSGQIIVIKPDSGRILAMANYPFFDPNKYSSEVDFDIFQNAAAQKVFEPGSVFKPFTMAMALQEGKVSPDSTFVDTGSVTIGPDTVYNFDRKTYGQQPMSGILEKSINTGAVFLAKLLPHSIFFEYLDKLGFNSKTGVDVQGEVSSKNELLKKGSDFGFATSSFGQGIEMTPVQLAKAFCVFANGGKTVKPFLVEKIVHGVDVQATKAEVSSQVISGKTAADVTTMLINVVEQGFGNKAKIHGYYLAGKTGTAEVPLEHGRGYYADKTIQSFIGFGPALNPQFLILVKLDNPKVPKSSLSAAPIFKKLAQYIINYWQIPPDY